MRPVLFWLPRLPSFLTLQRTLPFQTSMPLNLVNMRHSAPFCNYQALVQYDFLQRISDLNCNPQYIWSLHHLNGPVDMLGLVEVYPALLPLVVHHSSGVLDFHSHPQLILPLSILCFLIALMSSASAVGLYPLLRSGTNIHSGNPFLHGSRPILVEAAKLPDYLSWISHKFEVYLYQWKFLYLKNYFYQWNFDFYFLKFKIWRTV